MRSQLQDAPNKEATVAGIVNGDGTINAGAGFTVTKIAVGQYVVRIQRPAIRFLRSIPATQVLSGGFIVVGAVGQDWFQVNTYNTSVAAADNTWTFTVVGVTR